MKRISVLSSKYICGCGLVLGLFAPLAAHAQAIPIYSFTGGGDGANPPCGLISGGKGILPSAPRFYGTTEEGGANDLGTVYEVKSTGSESVIYSFAGGSDGAYPAASVINDAAGNLYGTTQEGGTYGVGVVFKVAPDGSETVLYTFAGGPGDGAYPSSSLIMDAAGNLYGTTFSGGAEDAGTVFEVESGGSETVLHSFAGGTDGAYPEANLVMDVAGNLYGTTGEGGGAAACTGGCGTIFKLAPGGAETVLHAFRGDSDGANPQAGLLMQKSGGFFGTTVAGGSTGNGTVFELTRKGKEKILYSFAGGSDGAYPEAAVVERLGYLYGTTSEGGGSNEGTVFKVAAKGASETVLYAFTGGSDGGEPLGSLLSQAGTLFGTTFAGGTDGAGVVFKIAP